MLRYRVPTYASLQKEQTSVVQRERRSIFLQYPKVGQQFICTNDAGYARQTKIPAGRRLVEDFRIGLGLARNTIVVFQSDQGHSTEDRGFGGGGYIGGYRGSKFSLFEGGIKVSAFINWPGHIGEGAVRGIWGEYRLVPDVGGVLSYPVASAKDRRTKSCESEVGGEGWRLEAIA